MVPIARKKRAPAAAATFVPHSSLRILANVVFSSRRTALLERKLDDLVTLLAVNHQPSRPVVHPVGHVVPNGNSARPVPLNRLPTTTASFQGALNPSPADEVGLLAVFRTHFAHQFPFVVIAPNKSAQELQQESPHLYQTILMVASCREPSRQTDMAAEVLQNLTTKIVLKGEAKLDFLQALLLYIAWLVWLYYPRY